MKKKRFVIHSFVKSVILIIHFSEFPGNWLSRNGAGAVPSNVDENDQGSDIESSSNKGPIPLGRPEECSAHFTGLESPCQVLEKLIIDITHLNVTDVCTI